MKLLWFVILLVFGCSPSLRKSPERDFICTAAWFNRWKAGYPGAGKGTDYYITLVVLANKKLQFDSLLIHQQSFPVFISRPSVLVSSNEMPVGRGDTIVLRAESPVVNDTTSAYKASILYRKDNKPKIFHLPSMTEQTTPERQ